MNGLASVAAKEQRIVAGFMSGTSMDGVDAALTRIQGDGPATQVELLGFATRGYSSSLRERILGLQMPSRFDALELAWLRFELAELYADMLAELVDSQGLRLADVDLIDHHGVIPLHRNGFHVDICEGSVIAERTGVDVITDFRVRDCAVGGQGAPLSPYVDWILFNAPDRCRAVQNIGGIANVCAIPRNATVDDLIGFDTGPGNMIIDGLVGLISDGELTYDRDGVIAASGHVDPELLEQLMGHPFIGRGLPKCAGREEFGAFFARDLLERARAEGRADADVIATATVFTAHAIAGADERFVAPKMQIDEVFITGGGAYNPVIMRHLGELLAPTPVVTHDAYGIPAAAREAVSWAVLANETLMGNPANVCQVTGAKRRVVLGKIIPA